MQKPVVLLIDNSISFTGAFKCALQQAELLKDSYEYIFLVPAESNLTRLLESKKIRYYTLPLLEIKKSGSALIRYVPRLLQNIRHLKRIVKKEAVDIVIMNDFYNLTGIGLKWSGWKGKLVTYVRLLPSAVPKPLREAWVRLAMRYADRIITVSDAVLKQLPSHKKIKRIYDPVFFTEKHPVVQLDGTTRLLYLSNYIKGKGQEYALAAFQLAHQINNSLRLCFAGGDMGLEKNKAFKESLREKVRQDGLEGSVSFLSYVSDVEEVIKKSHIVLNFSEAESFSMTCAEASFYGLPVIATKCGGPEEIIVDGQTGLLVDNRNVEQMSEAILRLSSSKEMCVEFSKNGRELVRQKFHPVHFRNQLENVLSSLVSK